jgi:CheY-like chemotaxis protein
VKEINVAGERAAILTQQLLAFGRKQFFHPVNLDLNQLIEEMQGMIQRLVGEDVVVETRSAPDLPLVFADPNQMSQILMNLAANARDAMPHGGRLTIRTAKFPAHNGDPGTGDGDDKRERVILAVTDTGDGIPKEAMQHLFEPFFTTKEPGRGTGLGLSTVYGIVRQSDGWIDVQSELGKGTTFSIYLLALESSSVRGQVQESSTTPARIDKYGTVLIVEDQEQVRELVKSVLEAEGFKVLEAAGGPEALSLSSHYSGPIHLLITDLIMPEMTGKQVADKLRPLRPGMKVMYMSGYNEDILARRGVDEPDVPYLAKPFTPRTLSAKVHEVLGHVAK